MKPIYLDHAAATPLNADVFRRMAPYWSRHYANPGNISRAGQEAKTAIDESRMSIARTLGAHPEEIIFTGSGTESANLAVLGIMRSFPDGHIVTTAIEHHAVLEPVQALHHEGYTSTIVPVPTDGIVRPADIFAAILPTTRLVSVMLANNEIGTIQPIEEIAHFLRQLNRKRKRDHLPPVLLHTDACQAAPYLPLAVDVLGVDALTLNGAKINGPKSVGVLYLRRGTACQPIILGGGQERGLRSGTENAALIVGMATAFVRAQRETNQEGARVSFLRDRLRMRLSEHLSDLRINGDLHKRLPNNLSLTLPGIDAESLLLYLDRDGVIIGTGAACSTKTLEPSHVLKAIGLSESDALSTIRLTLGSTTTLGDVERAARILIKRVQWLKAQTKEQHGNK